MSTWRRSRDPSGHQFFYTKQNLVSQWLPPKEFEDCPDDIPFREFVPPPPATPYPTAAPVDDVPSTIATTPVPEAFSSQTVSHTTPLHNEATTAAPSTIISPPHSSTETPSAAAARMTPPNDVADISELSPTTTNVIIVPAAAPIDDATHGDVDDEPTRSSAPPPMDMDVTDADVDPHPTSDSDDDFATRAPPVLTTPQHAGHDALVTEVQDLQSPSLSDFASALKEDFSVVHANGAGRAFDGTSARVDD